MGRAADGDANGWSAADSLTGLRAGIERSLERTKHPRLLGERAPEVSAWSVGQHLEHLYLADRAVLRWIADAIDRPAVPGREHSLRDIGISLLARGSIPRGRGPAPDFSLPSGMDAADLLNGLETLRRDLDGLARRIDEVEVCLHTHPHHILGHFTPAEWLRFLHLHHQHHAVIIADILAAPAPGSPDGLGGPDGGGSPDGLGTPYQGG